MSSTTSAHRLDSEYAGLSRKIEALRASAADLDIRWLAADDSDRRTLNKLAGDRKAIQAELQDHLDARAAIDSLRAKARETDALATYRTNETRRAEIARQVVAVVSTERELVGKLAAAQRSLLALIDEDGALASSQANAVASARLTLDPPPRLIGLGVFADLDRIAADLARDEASVKERP